MKCISCGKKTAEGVRFSCPKCNEKISRCGRCRSLSLKYKCPKCGYEGP